MSKLYLIDLFFRRVWLLRQNVRVLMAVSNNPAEQSTGLDTGIVYK